MCTNKNNDKSKTNLPSPPFHFSYSFLNCWKTTKSVTLKFQTFGLTLCEKLSVIA